MARWFIAALLLLLLALQYRIWFGPADLFAALALHGEMAQQRAENEQLRERNAALAAEVRDLKQGTEAVEERARSELGMVKKDETFYQIVGRPTPTAMPAATPATAPASVPAAAAPTTKPATAPPP